MEQLQGRGGHAREHAGILVGKSSVEEAALRQGMENLMIETDSPLLQLPNQDAYHEPAFLRYLGQFATRLFGIRNNAEKTFENVLTFTESEGIAAMDSKKAQPWLRSA